jgi:hypothetical protein
VPGSIKPITSNGLIFLFISTSAETHHAQQKELAGS